MSTIDTKHKVFRIVLACAFTMLAYCQAAHAQNEINGQTQIRSGTVPMSALKATGTPSSSTYLRGDGTWATIAMAGVFGAAGGSHTAGLVPDPGATAHGTPYYLGDDAAFHALPGGTTYTGTSPITVSGTTIGISAATTSASGSVQLETGSSDTTASHAVTANDTRLNNVSSIDSTTGALTFSAGSNMTITQSGSTFTFASSGGGGSGTVSSGTSGQIAGYPSSGTSVAGVTVSGDGTLNGSTGALVVTKTNGTSFAASATTDTTNASNITSGTLPAARIPVTTVSAGTYVNPTITVQADGRLIAASSSTGSTLPTDYISGIIPSYSSTTILNISAGTVYVPSLAGTVTYSGGTYTPSPSLPSYQTLYYVFINSSGSFLYSATAPTTNYAGSAWEDSSGDRYLFTILSGSIGSITNFLWQPGNVVLYRPTAGVFAAPFEVHSTAPATTLTAQSCSAIVPATSRVAIADVSQQYAGLALTVYIGSSDGSIPSASTGSQEISTVGTGSATPTPMELALNSSQQFQYIATTTTTGYFLVYVLGYVDNR